MFCVQMLSHGCFATFLFPHTSTPNYGKNTHLQNNYCLWFSQLCWGAGERKLHGCFSTVQIIRIHSLDSLKQSVCMEPGKWILRPICLLLVTKKETCSYDFHCFMKRQWNPLRSFPIAMPGKFPRPFFPHETPVRAFLLVYFLSKTILALSSDF